MYVSFLSSFVLDGRLHFGMIGQHSIPPLFWFLLL